jgi:hypothetical protein
VNYTKNVLLLFIDRVPANLFFPLQPPPIQVLRSQFEDRETWPHEHPVFLEGAQGLLFNQKKKAAKKEKRRIS